MAVLESFKGGLSKFNRSGEKTAAIGAIGALVGVFTANYIPQFLSKYTNLAVGIILVIAAVFIKQDGVGYFLLGMGVILVVDGAVRVIFNKNISMITAGQTPITSLASLKAKF